MNDKLKIAIGIAAAAVAAVSAYEGSGEVIEKVENFADRFKRNSDPEPTEPSA